MSNVTEIRSPMDTEGLKKYLSSNPASSSPKTTKGSTSLPIFDPKNIIFKQFKFGQSNPTYLIEDPTNGSKFVLRRKPSPNDKLVSKSAHAIEREFFILNGINICNKSNSDATRHVPVPDVYLLCEDESVIGYVFYLMQYIDGRQIVNPSLPGIPENEKIEYWNSIMETISSIHSLDTTLLIKHLPANHFPQFQPEKLAKSVGGSTYFQRQIKTLSSVSKLQSKTVKEIPHFEKICSWLLRKAPQDPSKPTLIHGDFKIDNILFDKSSSKIITVLDWELCTFGHPLFDLANFLQPFQLPNELNLLLYKPDKTDMGREASGSIDSVYDNLKIYQQKLGSDWNSHDKSNNAIDNWDVGFVFGLLRLCVISQGIAMRVAKGNASSAEASGYANLYPYLAGLAVETIDQDESKSKL